MVKVATMLITINLKTILSDDFYQCCHLGQIGDSADSGIEKF